MAQKVYADVLGAVGSEWDTTQTIARRLGWKTDRARRHLMVLANEGHVDRRGGETRNGHWHYFAGWQWRRRESNASSGGTEA